MKKYLLMMLLAVVINVCAEDTTASASFKPPEGWRLADQKTLPESVQVMVVGKGRHAFPPSINLATESFNGTMQEYLEIVKKINKENRSEWKRLGLIPTQAGSAELSEATATTQFGKVKMMHAMLLKEGTMYIISAAALRDEFPDFYQDFFTSIRSFQLND